MTTDAQLAPTDDEIHAVVQACRERGLREFDVFRAVLAKWGTQPQPGAVDRTGCTAGTEEECTRRGCATSCPAQQAAPKAAPVKACVCGEPQASGTVHRVDGPCYVAAPKAAPGEPDKLMRDCLALLESFDYEDDEDSQSKAFFNAHINADWFFHVKHSIERQLEAKAAPQQEAQEPSLFVSSKQLAALTDPDDPDGEHGRYLPVRKTSKGLFTQPLYTAPQPAPAPLSEMPYEKRKAIQEGEQIGASDAWFKARHEMLDTVDRRNVFRAGFDRGWSAALAAQGGK